MAAKKKAAPAVDSAEQEFDTIRIPKILIMAPEPKLLPEAEYTEISSNMRDLRDDEAVFDRLTRMAVQELTLQIDEYDQQIADLEEKKSVGMKQIAEIMDRQKTRSLSFGDFTNAWIYSSNSSLDKDLLLLNGVTSAQIAASHKTKRFRYFKVTNNARAAAEKLRKKQEKAEAAENE